MQKKSSSILTRWFWKSEQKSKSLFFNQLYTKACSQGANSGEGPALTTIPSFPDLTKVSVGYINITFKLVYFHSAVDKELNGVLEIQSPSKPLFFPFNHNSKKDVHPLATAPSGSGTEPHGTIGVYLWTARSTAPQRRIRMRSVGAPCDAQACSSRCTGISDGAPHSLRCPSCTKGSIKRMCPLRCSEDLRTGEP